MRIETPSIAQRIEKDAVVLHRYEHLKELLFSVVVIASFSVFVALSKGYLRVPLRIPGHSAIYVIPLILLGRLASRNRFAGIGIGGLSGGIMAFTGIGGGFFLAIPRYLMMGAVVDILLWKKWTRENMTVLVVAGAFANIAKFFMGMVIATLVGIPAFFIQLGMTYSLITHLAFGVAGGLIAFGVLKAIRHIQKNVRKKGHRVTG
ncbi:MAG: hypothetical protein JSV43_03510 [Methanobacteriota archaeon]|nr:MAG: hypothetical protein JSV43_03510 [Euryarchaeota archaeon]